VGLQASGCAAFPLCNLRGDGDRRRRRLRPALAPLAGRPRHDDRRGRRVQVRRCWRSRGRRAPAQRLHALAEHGAPACQGHGTPPDGTEARRRPRRSVLDGAFVARKRPSAHGPAGRAHLTEKARNYAPGESGAEGEAEADAASEAKADPGTSPGCDSGPDTSAHAWPRSRARCDSRYDPGCDSPHDSSSGSDSRSCSDSDSSNAAAFPVSADPVDPVALARGGRLEPARMGMGRQEPRSHGRTRPRRRLRTPLSASPRAPRQESNGCTRLAASSPASRRSCLVSWTANGHRHRSHDHLPRVRGREHRGDADERLPVLLHMPQMLSVAAPASRRLLRVLFVR
jgi:hypothetical protein